MSDVTNYDGRLEAMAGYCATMYENLAKVNNAYHDSVENVYSKALPDKYFDFKKVKKIGGKTVLMNQKIRACNTTYWRLKSGYTSYSSADDVITCSVTSPFAPSSTNRWQIGVDLNGSHQYSVVEGHKYYIHIEIKQSAAGSCKLEVLYGSPQNSFNVDSENTWTSYSGVATAVSSSSSGAFLVIPWVDDYTDFTYQFRNAMLIDLTEKYGAGNEPSTAQEEEARTPVPQAYNPGSLLNAGVVSVISKDADDATLETYTVPEEVTSVEGYGWSCPGAYNYIDFEAKKFVQAVGSRAYEAGDESDATVITDKTNTHYELDEPLAFDVDLPDEAITKAVAGGSLTFANQHGSDYRIPVPVQVEYIGV